MAQRGKVGKLCGERHRGRQHREEEWRESRRTDEVSMETVETCVLSEEDGAANV